MYAPPVIERSADRVRAGVDVVAVQDVAASITRFQDRYLGRVFTPRELDDCGGPAPLMAQRLAARFAAKEAAIKVLRPVEARPPWHTIEVRSLPGGWCELRLSGEAGRLAAEAGIDELDVSLTHEAETAAAVVVALVRSQ